MAKFNRLITPAGTLDITTNGTYDVTEKASAVVDVPSTPTETITVDLAMASGNQVITPTSGKALSQVTVTKPSTMLAENIKKDVNIGGVVGTLESGGFTNTGLYLFLNTYRSGDGFTLILSEDNFATNTTLTFNGTQIKQINYTFTLNTKIKMGNYIYEKDDSTYSSNMFLGAGNSQGDSVGDNTTAFNSSSGTYCYPTILGSQYVLIVCVSSD